jgi:hypothetical protein
MRWKILLADPSQFLSEKFRIEIHVIGRKDRTTQSVDYGGCDVLECWSIRNVRISYAVDLGCRDRTSRVDQRVDHQFRVASWIGSDHCNLYDAVTPFHESDAGLGAHPALDHVTTAELRPNSGLVGRVGRRPFVRNQASFRSS